MKKKFFTLIISGVMISLSASSQTIRDNIDKVHKDKNTAERAAKADVLIHKKTILDTTQTKAIEKKIITKTPAGTKAKYKKKKHKKKYICSK